MDEYDERTERIGNCGRRSWLKKTAAIGSPVTIPHLGNYSESWGPKSRREQSSAETLELDYVSEIDSEDLFLPRQNVDGSEPIVDTNSTRTQGTATLTSALELRHYGFAGTVGGPVFKSTFTPESSGRYRITATQYGTGESRQSREGEGKIAAINVVRPKLSVREKQSGGPKLNVGPSAPIKHAKLRALAREEIIETVLDAVGFSFLPWDVDVDFLEEIMAEIGADTFSEQFGRKNNFKSEPEIEEFDLTTTFSAAAGTEYEVETRLQVFNAVFSVPDVVDKMKLGAAFLRMLRGEEPDFVDAVDTERDRISNDFSLTWELRNITAEAVDKPAGPGSIPVNDAVFSIVATEEAELYYMFAVRGDVEKTEVSDAVRASENDALISGKNDDIVTVRGFTGNPGYGDAFRIDGELLWFKQTGGTSDYRLALDDRSLLPSDIGSPSGEFERDPPTRSQYIEGDPVEGVLEIVATDEAELYYTIVVKGDVEKTETSEKIAASKNDTLPTGNNDEIVTIRGFTGNPGYGDAYKIDGVVLALHRVGGASDFFIRLNGERITVQELLRGDV